MATKKSQGSGRAASPASKRAGGRAAEKMAKSKPTRAHETGDATAREELPRTTEPVACSTLRTLRERVELAGRGSKSAAANSQRDALVKALAGLEEEYARLRTRY